MELRYGVMVAQEILVLFVEVRILLSQRNPRNSRGDKKLFCHPFRGHNPQVAGVKSNNIPAYLIYKKPPDFSEGGRLKRVRQNIKR